MHLTPRLFYHFCRLLICLASFFVLPSLALGTDEPETPDWLKAIPRVGVNGAPLLPPCELEYKMSWSGVLTAGKARIRMNGDPHPDVKGYTAYSSGQSAGLARAIWPYDYEFVSVVDPKTAHPIFFRSKETDKKASLWTINNYKSSGVLNTSYKQKHDQEDKRERKNKFPHGQARDLLSTILFLHSLPMENGSVVPIVVYPFTGAYLTTFTVLGREEHRTKFGKIDCVKLDVQIRRVEDDLTLSGYEDKLRSATLWVSDDEYRIPVEVRAEIFVGSVRAELTKFDLLEKEAE